MSRREYDDLLGGIGSDDEFLPDEQAPLGLPRNRTFAPGQSAERFYGTRRSFEPAMPGVEWEPGAWDQESQYRLQQQLVAAGLVKAQDITPGFWDNTSASAYRKLLMFANQRTMRPEQAAGELAALTGGPQGEQATPINPYDVEDMALKLKEHARRFLVPISDDAALKWAHDIVMGQLQQPTVG